MYGQSLNACEAAAHFTRRSLTSVVHCMFLQRNHCLFHATPVTPLLCSFGRFARRIQQSFTNLLSYIQTTQCLINVSYSSISNACGFLSGFLQAQLRFLKNPTEKEVSENLPGTAFDRNSSVVTMSRSLHLFSFPIDNLLAQTLSILCACQRFRVHVPASLSVGELPALSAFSLMSLLTAALYTTLHSLCEIPAVPPYSHSRSTLLREGR